MLRQSSLCYCMHPDAFMSESWILFLQFPLCFSDACRFPMCTVWNCDKTTKIVQRGANQWFQQGVQQWLMFAGLLLDVCWNCAQFAGSLKTWLLETLTDSPMKSAIDRSMTWNASVEAPGGLSSVPWLPHQLPHLIWYRIQPNTIWCKLYHMIQSGGNVGGARYSSTGKRQPSGPKQLNNRFAIRVKHCMCPRS